MGPARASDEYSKRWLVNQLFRGLGMSDKQEQPVEQTKDIVVDDAAEGELIEQDSPMEDDPNDDSYDGGLIVVGVGASAGGLEALQDMVATIPPI